MRDSQEFRLFFEGNYPKFYSFAYQLIGDRETCRDIVSDAFEYAWLKMDYAEVENLTNYIYSYIRNKCVSHIRHQAVHSKYADMCQQLYQREQNYERPDIDDQIAAMHRIMDGFTPQTRQIFEMCYIEKKKYKEVADALGITTSTVQKHIVRALKLLREGIKKVSG